MADVSIMRSTLLGILERKYFQDFALVFGFKDELEKLQSLMNVLSAFLSDFDTENKHADNTWWTELRKAFDDARVIFEEIEYEAKRNAVVKMHGSIHTKIFEFFSCFRNPYAFRIKIANRIQDIMQKTDELISQGRERGIIEHVKTPTRELTPAENLDTWYRFKPGGRLEEKEKIIKLLMRQQSHANNVEVISIVAMGGLGKTTLAKMIYNDDRVKEQFNMLMWVCVSDDFDLANSMPYETVKMHGVLYGLAKSTLKEIDTRTIVLPCLKEAFMEPEWASKKFDSLKVLHLQHMELKFLPDDCFANMKLLRYLNLGDCILEKLPNSICTLQNLQFLNLHRCYNLQELPKNMENLISLQVLFLTVNAINLSSLNIASFQQLKTLFLLDCVNLVSLPCAIRCLSILRKLMIHGCDGLMNFEDEDEEEKKHVENHYLNLRVLEIVGSHKLEALPNWLKRARKLESLRIAGTRIKSFPEWFPISSFLERLYIYSCPKLSSLPIDMDPLHCLKHLEIVDCPKLWARYNKHTGPDVHIINHVPHCKVDYYY